ncbi:MAG: hypothetical protein IT361_11445 [Gemmatimonadaceae bacterium]|nr:hypothetical protein [Gemmatimonadaceae bacterium]
MIPLSVARVDLRTLSLHDRIAAADHAAAAAEALAGAPAIVLHTCERFEVYTSTAGGVDATLVACGFDCVERATGTEAFRHLLRVASGVASRIPGEPHVLGQVRAALGSALAAGVATPELAHSFTAAIRGARLVRERSAIGAGEGGYAARAVATVATTFENTPDAHIVVVGSGAMAREVAHGLARAGLTRITIAGRHLPSVQNIAAPIDAASVELAVFAEGRIESDAVVAAVSSRRPILTAAGLRASGARLVVDLGAVPGIGPVDAALGPTIVRLEDLAGDVRGRVLEDAERLVEQEVARHAARALARRQPRDLSERRAS